MSATDEERRGNKDGDTKDESHDTGGMSLRAKRSSRKIAEEDPMEVDSPVEEKPAKKAPRKSKTVKNPKVNEIAALSAKEVATGNALEDVELEYSDDDFDNLTDFKSYNKQIRPLVAEFNTNAPADKMDLLMIAKWKEFHAEHPHPNKLENVTVAIENYLTTEVTEKAVPSPAPDAAASSSKKDKRKRKKRTEGTPRRSGKDSSDEEFEKQLEEMALAEETAKTQQAERRREQRAHSSSRKPPKHNSKRLTAMSEMVELISQRKKRRLNADGDGYETDHQEHCEVCNAGGEIILCDACPKAFHLICLEPPLENAPEGRWVCPRCAKDGISIDDVEAFAGFDDAIPEDNEAFCKVCRDGGTLLCCDTCPCSYHLKCLVPPLEGIPEGEWKCPRCLCVAPKADIQKILWWKFVDDLAPDSGASDKEQSDEEKEKVKEVATEEKKEADEKEDKDAEAVAKDKSSPAKPKKKEPKTLGTKHREFFVKYKNLAYWYCDWVTELQLDVFKPIMLRCFVTKNGGQLLDPPAVIDYDADFDENGVIIPSNKPESEIDPDSLEERFYKYGIKPEWLNIQRVINHSVDPKKGFTWYLVKWCDLNYDQCTWEPEDADLPDLASYVEAYWNLREVMMGPSIAASEAKRGKKGKKKKAAKESKSEDSSKNGKQLFYRPPPDKPSTDLLKPLEKQPDYIAECGGELHPYQLEGLNWLRYSWQKKLNTILADEMGLGKTIQTIAFLYSLYKEGHSRGPFLVSAPLSTITNWEREFEFWARDFYVVNYTGDKNCRAVIRENEFTLDEVTAAKIGNRASKMKNTTQVKFHVLLCSYELCNIDSQLLSSVPWSVLVVDEAHRLKNNQSLFFRTLNTYTLGYKLLLTGTPLQNNLEELFNLLNFMEPSRFDDLASFLSQFADISKEEQVEKLHDLIGPHMLRRLKSDVLKGMPSKSEFIVRVEMTPTQKKIYRHILTKNFEALNAKGSHSTSLLNVMMDLKKCCNHPYLFTKASMEAPRANDCRYEGSALIKACGKLELLQKMMALLKKQGHRVLIFSQMTRVLDVLEDFCEAEGYRYERLDGNITGYDRQERIDRFNTPGGLQAFVFLLSTRAGGLGINLATADTVVIYDSDWNPHNDIQAFSRAHRIGQANKVMIYRFVTRASVEERITQIAKKKMMLTHLVVRPGLGPKNNAMSKQEVDDILKFGAEKLFKDEAEGDDEQRIVYDDKAISGLLDRSQEGEEQREFAMNDYFQSFKVATYAMKGAESEDSDEEEREIIKQENDAAMDPHYWEKLLRVHYEEEQEKEFMQLGKGRRVRKKVNYALDNRSRAATAAADDDDEWAPSGAVAGQEMSDNEWQNDDGQYDDDDASSDEDAEKIRRKLRKANERPMPPLLAKIAGQLEVLSFTTRQRKSFLNAIMRYGMPPTDITPSGGGSLGCGQWLVRDLKSKPLKVFKAYCQLFMRHLCEPQNMVPTQPGEPDCFSDGVPREGLMRQQVLTRIGIMGLIRKKVQEFEVVNGLRSICNASDEKYDKTPAQAKAEYEMHRKKKEEEVKAEVAEEAPKTTIEPVVRHATPKPDGANDQPSTAAPVTEPAATEVKEEGVNKEEVVEEDKMEVDEAKDQHVAPAEETKTEKSKSTDEMEVVAVEDTTDGKDTEEDKEKEEEKPNPACDPTKFMFNVADGGFTELHSVWENEEKAVMQEDDPDLKYRVWNRRHDYWLLAGIINHGYGRWGDIQTDDRFQIINRPFDRDAVDDLGRPINTSEACNKFLSRRFKLLEQALVVEEQLRRAVYQNLVQDPGHQVMQLAQKFSELETVAHANAAVPEIIQQDRSNVAVSSLAHTLSQIEELLMEMREAAYAVPNAFVKLPPVNSRLQMTERNVLSKLTTGESPTGEGAEKPSTSSDAATAPKVEKVEVASTAPAQGAKPALSVLKLEDDKQ